MKFKNKKAFTMVELLAVIAIIGILAGVTIPSISKYVSSSKEEYKEDVKKTLTLAGKNYYSEHKSEQPQKDGIYIKQITAKELATQKYITGTFQDADQNDCTNQSYVTAVYETDTINYYPCLICKENNYITTDKEKEYCNLVDSTTPEPSKPDQPDTPEKPEEKTNLECSLTDTEIEKGVLKTTINATTNKDSITGILLEKKYNGKTSTQSILDDTDKDKKSINKTITIAENGTYRVYVQNNSLQTQCKGTLKFVIPEDPNFKVEKYLVDESSYNSHKTTGYTQTELSNLQKYDGSWTNGYVYVKLTYNKNYFKEVKVNNTETITGNKYLWLTEEGDKTNKIVAISKNDKTKSATIGTKLDRTPPVIGRVNNSSNGNWTNQDITVTIPYQDSYSGVDPTNVVYKLSEIGTEYKDWSSTPTANQATKKWARTNRQLVMYIVVTDRAGNTSKVCNNSPCRTNIYQDITPPTVYRHCFHQKTSNEYQFYMYMKDDGGSNIDVYRWKHCYSYCPNCSKSYLCSTKSAYTRMAESKWYETIKGKASHIRITHYNIFPPKGSKITVNSRMQIKDKAGNVFTSPSDIVHTYYYNGSTDPGRC